MKSHQNILMQNEKEEVKSWLKKIGKDRDWLAEKCFVKKKSVDDWFRNGKKLPKAKLALIRGIMTEIELKEREKETLIENAKNSIKNISLVFTEEEWDMIEYCANKRKTTPERYCADVIIESSYSLKNHGFDHYYRNLKENTNERYTMRMAGNIAAGSPWPGDTEPYNINLSESYPKDHYALRVCGGSMEPVILDGSIVVVKPHTVPPIPKLGTIVVYADERGVTLKRLGKHDDGSYILESINDDYPDIEPMDGGKITAIYVETLDKYSKM